MVGNGVHHDGKGDNVAAHDEDGKQDLAQSEELATKPTQEDLSGIRQVMNVRVSLAKLADDISGVQCNNTESDDEDDRTATVSKM